MIPESERIQLKRHYIKCKIIKNYHIIAMLILHSTSFDLLKVVKIPFFSYTIYCLRILRNRFAVYKAKSVSQIILLEFEIECNNSLRRGALSFKYLMDLIFKFLA